MKAVVISEYAEFGGIISALKSLVFVLEKLGFDVLVIFDSSYPSPKMPSFLSSKRVQFFNRKRWAAKSFVNIVVEWLFYRKLLKEIEPDLVIVNSATFGRNFGALLTGLPFVFVVQSTPQHRWLRIYAALLRKMKNTIVVAPSQFVAKCLRDIGIQGVEVIPNSVLNLESNKKIVLQNSEVKVVTAGILDWFKGPEVWFNVAKEVVRKHPQVQFYWYGNGPMFERVSKLIIDNSLESKIHVMGMVEDFKSHVDSNTIYFQPSLYETQGLALIEAMLSGCACVASNVGALVETVHDKKGGYLCPPDSVEKFVSFICDLIESPKTRLKFSEYNKSTAIEKYSPELHAKSLNKTFRERLQLLERH